MNHAAIPPTLPLCIFGCSAIALPSLKPLFANRSPMLAGLYDAEAIVKAVD
jgi:hypothetical protein